MLVHTKAASCRCTGGLAIMDLGSKAGTFVGGRRLQHPFLMEPLKNGEKIKVGASTRSYEVKVNLKSQIERLEQQQRELLREVQAIDQDAADPVQAAKRQAREDATCFVGNLEPDTEKADLLILFQDCGHVDEVRFPGQQEAGGKAVKGIAFVIFDTPMAARRAVGLTGEMFKGKKVRVALAADKGGKGGGGGGKGGKGKDKDKDDRAGDGEGSSHDKDKGGGSRQFLRDMLDGKWERGVALASQSPERPRRIERPASRFDQDGRPARARSPSEEFHRMLADQNSKEQRRRSRSRSRDRSRDRSRSRSERRQPPKEEQRRRDRRLAKRKDSEDERGKGKTKKKAKKRKKSSSGDSSSSNS